MAAFKASSLNSRLYDYNNSQHATTPSKSIPEAVSNRIWVHRQHEARPPMAIKEPGRNIGQYPFTSGLASWVKNAMINFQPDDQVLELVSPFSAQFHAVVVKERKSSSGLHDLDVVEFTYQITLETAAAILLAADSTDDPVELQDEFHSSKAGNDDHFASWGLLLTGLQCDPPIIAIFPVYLMMCQAFTFESNSAREDYVYSALTGIDWAKGKNMFSEKLTSFEMLARRSVPKLDDTASGQDRSFWRIAHAYVGAMNACENSRQFKTPRQAAIKHEIDHDLIIAMRALDTIGSAYMCSDGAAWLDNAGIDSLIGSGLANDIMDLHTDIKTGETRNLLRLLYPDGLGMAQAMKTVSTILSGELCELFRGHHRARFNNREDGRVAATSPPYSFCRARHRRIFEIMETYINRYPRFWDWTWEIYRMAKEQVTEAGLSEPLVCALKRSVKQESLPPSLGTSFYDIYYDLVEGTEQLKKKRPLGVSDDLSQVVRDLHHLWHTELLAAHKEPGWGRGFDIRSDMLFGEAGKILLESGNPEDRYKFGIAYGRLSMALPYIAYHTIGALIIAFGVEG